jgi:hypothetical protein
MIRLGLRIWLGLAVAALLVALGPGAREAGATVPLSSLQWTKLSPASAPPPIYAGSLAYEPGAERLLFFGGQSAGENLNETGVWDGSNWIQLSPDNSPPGGFTAPLVYDPASEKMLLYNEETWTWDGADWANAAPTQSPPARHSTQMAYDAATEQMILFGGETGSFVFANDMWTWDGSDWSELSPAHRPSARSGAALAYDAATEQLILFGGQTINGIPKDLNDTWVWNGTDWEELSPPHSPSARSSASIAYDAAAARLILFGGYTQGGATLGETWAWNGADWEEVATANPPARSIASMAYDVPTEQLVLFGGAGATGNFQDTWTFGLPIPPTEPSNPGTPPATGSSAPPPAPAPIVRHCIVPKLKGKKLKAAKKKLGAADCRAGKVKLTKGATAKTGKVKTQSQKPGRVLAAGVKVNLKLG